MTGAKRPWMNKMKTFTLTLLLGAVAMHLKIHDPSKKSAPALAMFAACLTISIAVLS